MLDQGSHAVVRSRVISDGLGGFLDGFSASEVGFLTRGCLRDGRSVWHGIGGSQRAFDPVSGCCRGCDMVTLSELLEDWIGSRR